MDEEKRTVWNAPAPAALVNAEAFAGKKPNRTISVPLEYRRKTLARERNNLVYDIWVQANCHVIPHWEQGSGTIASFDVYGAGPAVEKATGLINQWISSAHMQPKALAASSWAKTPAYNYNNWYYEQVEEMENARKQLYRGPMPAEGHPDAPHHFHVVDWPESLTEDSRTPRDVFGNKLERLDGLRMQDKVWITLIKANVGQWQIEIAGHDFHAVEVAREHLDTLIDQVCVDATGVQHAYHIILDDREGIEVELQKNEDWWPNNTDKVVPSLLPSSLMGDMGQPGSYRWDGLHEDQLSSLEKVLKGVLDSVRDKKGAYDFVIRLGSIVLNSKDVSNDKIGQVYSKKSFLKDINDRVELDVKKWLVNDDVGYRILHRLMSKKDILEPTRSAAFYGYMPKDLDKTRPVFRGTWVFRDPNTTVGLPAAPSRHPGRPTPFNQKSLQKEEVTPPPSVLFVVQIDWTDDEEGQYEKGSPRYYKLAPGQQGPKKNMDVNLLELGESRAWHFALESLIPVPSKAVPPIVTGFVRSVQMKPKYNLSSTGSFAEWDMTPTVKRHLVTGRLDSIYCFGIKETCYKAELTAMWYPGQAKPVWGLAVRHDEWATHLAELERLPLGRRADWGNTISTFFPTDGQMSAYIADTEDINMSKLKIDDGLPPTTGNGLRILVESLLKLSEIVSSVTEEGGVDLLY